MYTYTFCLQYLSHVICDEGLQGEGPDESGAFLGCNVTSLEEKLEVAYQQVSAVCDPTGKYILHYLIQLTEFTEYTLYTIYTLKVL